MKPHPSIFEEALRRAGVTAAEAVMVGDSVPHDIAGALAPRHARDPGRAVRAVEGRAARRSGHPVAARAEGPAVIIRPLDDDRGVPPGGGAREGRLGLHRRRGRRPAAGADRVGRSAAASCSARSTRRGVMKGFVYSIPAVKDGRSTQWSHMLGVTRDARDAGLGLRLKLAQRERVARDGHRSRSSGPTIRCRRSTRTSISRSSASSSRNTRRTSTASRAARCTAARRPIASSPSGG